MAKEKTKLSSIIIVGNSQTGIKVRDINISCYEANIFPQIVDHSCRLDVHKETIVSTIRGSGLEEETRTSGTFTEDLELFRDWLKRHSVIHIAMKSTGVY